jgi:hypothetical protein
MINEVRPTRFVHHHPDVVTDAAMSGDLWSTGAVVVPGRYV